MDVTPLKWLGICIAVVVSMIAYFIVGLLMASTLVSATGMTTPVSRSVSDILWLVVFIGPGALLYGILSLISAVRMAVNGPADNTAEPKAPPSDE